MTDEPKITLKVKLDDILQTIGNKVTSWSNTPSNDKYPSEKLVKDSLDNKASTTDLTNGLMNIGAFTIHTVYNVGGSQSAFDISSGLLYTQQTPVFFLVKNTIYDNEANATLKYYPNGNNILIKDTFSNTSYSNIQQGVWKKDTWALFFCYGNSEAQLRCVFYDSVDIDEIKKGIFNILGIENLSYYVVSSVLKDKTARYNVNDDGIFDGNIFYLKVPYYETSTDIKVVLKSSSYAIKQGSNYVTESQVNGHLLKLRYNSGVFELLEIYDNDKLIPSFSDLSTVATSGSYNDLSDKPTIPTVPTNVSAFNNDSGYLKNTDLYDVMDCINVNFDNLDNIYLLDTVFNISNYNGLPSKNSSVVNDILRNNAVSQIGLNNEFTPSTKYTLEFDYYTSVSNRNGFSFGADPSLEDGTSMGYSDTGLQVLVDVSNTYVETFNGTSSPTNVYTHTSNLFTSGTHHIRIVRNNTNVTFYIDDVELYTYTNAKYNTIGLNKWGGGYNTISNIEIKIGG